MACLLAIAVVAMALLEVQPGQLTAFAARTSPAAAAAEAFWRAAMPGAPMPDAIVDLMHHHEEMNDLLLYDGKANAAGDDPPPVPPMNFNYHDYRSEAAAAGAAPSPDVLNRAAVAVQNADDVSSPPATATTVFFLEDAVRVGKTLPLPLPRSPDATAGGGAAAAALPVRLYTVVSVTAAKGSSFVVCRGETSATAGAGGVYGCRAVAGAARAYVVDAAAAGGGEGDAVIAAAAVVCHADTSRWEPDHAAFRLLGVRPGGAAVCRAVAGAHVLEIPAKN